MVDAALPTLRRGLRPADGAPASRRRVALVVQRYGEEINGGAELYARQVAERLAQRHAVQVLTSCALDYTTWAMHYAPGAQQVNGVPVLRFEHPQRNDSGRARIPRSHKMRFKTRALRDWLPSARVALPNGDPEHDGDDYLRLQGPHCPGLFEHLAGSHERYDAAIFFTALYEPSAQGLLRWGPRSLLVPFLHDEKAMHLPIFHRVFAGAGRLLFNSPSEQRLAKVLYGDSVAPSDLVGIGFDTERPAQQAIAEVRQRLRLPQRYFVYVGRVDKAKGCDDLLHAYASFARGEPQVGLALVGQRFMPIADDPRIISTGFVSESERDAIVAGSIGLIVPSRYESLSMSLLEAMKQRVPVIANARSEVLADHIADSGAGFAYRSRRGLAAAMLALARSSEQERGRFGQHGFDYVAARYSWPSMMEHYDSALAQVAGPAR